MIYRPLLLSIVIIGTSYIFDTLSMQKKQTIDSIFCLQDEYNSSTPEDDAFVRQLGKFTEIKKNIILVSKNIASALLQSNPDCFNDLSIFAPSSQTILLIPKNNCCTTPKSFTPVTADTLSSAPYIVTQGQIKKALLDLVHHNNNHTWFVFLAGHGFNPKSIPLNLLLDDNLQCGTSLFYLRQTLQGLSRHKNVALALIKGCYLGSPAILTNLAHPTYPYPVVCGSFCDAPTKSLRQHINSAEINTFSTALEELLSKNSLPTEYELFNTVNHLIGSEKYLQHTPHVLWPKEHMFKLLLPYQQDPNNTYNGCIKKHKHQLFLVQAITSKLKLENFGPKSLLGANTKLFFGNPHNLTYTISELETPHIETPQHLLEQIDMLNENFTYARKLIISLWRYGRPQQRLRNIIIEVTNSERIIRFNQNNDQKEYTRKRYNKIARGNNQ